jgi:antibiotic biosynthesis monooxygenase (ABM) superfamily enzyme
MITRRVRPDREAEFEKLMAKMLAAASRFPGHVGGLLVHPDRPSLSAAGTYSVLFAFDNDPHLQAWTESAERRALLERIAPTIYEHAPMRVLTGLEGSFALPDEQTQGPPPRHKMALVTWVGIFPLVLFFSTVVGPWVASLHRWLGAMVITALVVVAMTWLVMPLLVRLFAARLYPGATGTRTRWEQIAPSSKKK